jgi:hypothetical protein
MIFIKKLSPKDIEKIFETYFSYQEWVVFSYCDGLWRITRKDTYTKAKKLYKQLSIDPWWSEEGFPASIIISSLRHFWYYPESKARLQNLVKHKILPHI